MQNLVVTDRVRRALVAAGAALNHIPAVDYRGLTPGTTYLAYDPATRTYWAGAGLDPKRSSMRAMVSVQDDGAYLLFHRRAGRAWQAADVGVAGVGGSPCTVPLPDAVRARWGWAHAACHPTWGPTASPSS